MGACLLFLGDTCIPGTNQAARVFNRFRTEPQLVGIKNNIPAAVLLSPAEFA